MFELQRQLGIRTAWFGGVRFPMIATARGNRKGPRLAEYLSAQN
jgi:hypothetical protein